MKISRTIPPTASPINLKDLIHGIIGLTNETYYLERLRRELCDYLNVRYCFLFSSGKAALNVILTVLKELFPQKNEVLIPAYTCYSVPSSIVKAGLKVTLSDIDPETLDFDYNHLSTKITKQTLCIITCNLFGYIGDLDRLKVLAKDNGIYMVEDNAQCMGAEYKGQKVGGIGDVGFFSLGRGKNISLIEGGIIVTNNEVIAERLEAKWKVLRTYSYAEKLSLVLRALFIYAFLWPSLYWFPYSLPFLKIGSTVFSTDFKIKKMSGFQGGLAINWREKLNKFNKARNENANYYFAHINTDRISKVKVLQYTNPVYLRFPVIIKNSLVNKHYHIKKGNNLGISSMYPDSIDHIPQIKVQLKVKDKLKADRIAQDLLTLPTHPLLSKADKKRALNFLNSIS